MTLYTVMLFYNLILLCFHLNNLCRIEKSVFSCKRNNKDNIRKIPRSIPSGTDVQKAHNILNLTQCILEV